MKTVIKVLIPLLVLAGLGVIIFTTQKSIDEMHSGSIDKHDFKAYVSQYAVDSIQNQSVDDARIQYAKLYDIITTESSITVTDSNGTALLLDASDADECYQDAFDAYYPFFRNQADRLFNSSTWNPTELKNIKSEAEDLVNRKGVDQRSDSLNLYIHYVSGYYNCKSLIQSAKSCSSRSTYLFVKKHFSDYLCYPYNKCTDLRDVSFARQTAENAWKSSIEKEVGRIRDKYYGDNTSEFDSDRKKAEDRIDECYNEIRDYSWKTSQMNILTTKARSVYNYW